MRFEETPTSQCNYCYKHKYITLAVVFSLVYLMSLENPPDMPKTSYRANEGKYSERARDNNDIHPTLMPASVHHSSREMTALFLS